MTSKDFAAITAVGVLAVAVHVLLAGLGVELPAWVASVAPLAAGIIIGAVRIYVYVRGADETQADEVLDDAEQQVIDLSKRASK